MSRKCVENTPSVGHFAPTFERASSLERAARMLVSYEQGRIVHVLGDHAALERALRRFPLRKPFDLVGAAYWS
jgi:hypothetical protein